MVTSRNPFHALGLIFEDDGQGGKFLGTAAAYNNKKTFLTAAHCVQGRPVERLVLITHVDGRLRAIDAIEMHPKADLAILRVVPKEVDLISPFLHCAKVLGWGEDYLALGYPEDSSIDNATTHPTLRALRGHYQRLLKYKSYLGYEYAAGEVSAPFPEGMSGGPLFAPELPISIIGLAAENFRHGREIERVEKVNEGGERVIVESYAYIRYGIAVMLFDLREWLDARAPIES